MSPKPVMQECHIREMVPKDALDVAHLHIVAFPDYFLTRLGVRFLECLYYSYSFPPGVGVIALDNDKIIGFVTGMTDSKAFYTKFYRDNFLTLTKIVITHFFTDAVVRGKLLKKTAHFKMAILALLRRPSKEPLGTKMPPTAKMAYLLSIGVAEAYKGNGVADMLVKKYCKLLNQEGYERVLLSVLPTNHRAIRFYEKTGWKRAQSTDDSISFVRQTADG